MREPVFLTWTTLYIENRVLVFLSLSGHCTTSLALCSTLYTVNTVFMTYDDVPRSSYKSKN